MEGEAGRNVDRITGQDQSRSKLRSQDAKTPVPKTAAAGAADGKKAASKDSQTWLVVRPDSPNPTNGSTAGVHDSAAGSNIIHDGAKVDHLRAVSAEHSRKSKKSRHSSAPKASLTTPSTTKEQPRTPKSLSSSVTPSRQQESRAASRQQIDATGTEAKSKATKSQSEHKPQSDTDATNEGAATHSAISVRETPKSSSTISRRKSKRVAAPTRRTATAEMRHGGELKDSQAKSVAITPKLSTPSRSTAEWASSVTPKSQDYAGLSGGRGQHADGSATTLNAESAIAAVNCARAALSEMNTRDERIVCAFLVMTCAVVLALFSIGMAFIFYAKPAWSPLACLTPECVAARDYLSSIVNDSRDVCSDFYGYVCDSWLERRQDGGSFRRDTIAAWTAKMNEFLMSTVGWEG
ncbi:hypothetical protein MTO96_007691 [Rhipicephalus appendiculatus]